MRDEEFTKQLGSGDASFGCYSEIYILETAGYNIKSRFLCVFSGFLRVAKIRQTATRSFSGYTAWTFYVVAKNYIPYSGKTTHFRILVV